MDKKKAKDPQIWKRLGLELAALHDLIVEIQCDKDYASVMDSKTWDRLYKLTYHLYIVRSCAEERMGRIGQQEHFTPLIDQGQLLQVRLFVRK